MKKKALLSSILTIALCLSLIAGSTFALFTSNDKLNVAVNTGKVNVAASFVEGSLSHTSTLGAVLPETQVTTDGKTLTIDKMVPGDVVSFKIHVENGSDVTAQYRTILECVEDNGLLEGLEITLNGQTFYGFACDNWTTLAGNEAIADVEVVVTLPQERGNEYQGKTVKFAYLVEAVQGNAPVKNFDGVTVENINDFRLLASKVAAGESYEGQTVTLTADLDLKGMPLIPIGTASSPFLGTFNGQNHTVKNFSIAKHEGAGLFGYAGAGQKRAFISNVNADTFTIASNHYAGGIVGKLWGDVTGCTVTNAEIIVTPNGENGNYDNGDKVGGIVGWLDNGKADNNTVKLSTIIAYRDLGGIAGFANEEGIATSVSNNLVEDVFLNYDMSGKFYGNAQANLGSVLGRRGKATVTTDNNTVIRTFAPIMATPANVQECVENAAAGDTIYLSAGKYDAAITLTKGNLTIQGLPGAVVDCVRLNGQSNVTLKNITFDAAGAEAAVDAYKGGTTRSTANIIGAEKMGTIGAREIVIDGCTFTGTFANGGAAIAFADRSRKTGGSGNVTIKNCTFETEGAYYDVYGYYTSYYGLTFTFEGNTFKSNCLGSPIYLGRLKCSEAIVVKGNFFANFSQATFETDLGKVVYIQGDTSYSPSIDAADNTFGK